MNNTIQLTYERKNYHITSCGKNNTIIVFDIDEDFEDLKSKFSDGNSLYFKAKFSNLFIMYQNVVITNIRKHPYNSSGYTINISHDKISKLTLQEMRVMKLGKIFDDI